MNATPTPPSASTPNDGAPKLVKKKKRPMANPLVALRKSVPKPKPTAAPAKVGPKALIQPGLGQTLLKPLPGASSTNIDDDDGAYVDYPIVTTKRALLEGLRHHAMRFNPNSSATELKVNPADETQFTRPVRLHRRDPRVTAGGRWGEAADDSMDGKEVDDKDRERMEAVRADRRAEREANQAQIAPVSKGATQPKKQNKGFQRREQIYKIDESGEKKKAMQIHYEEAIPWHLEDFDNKNIWAGTYEAALSDCHVMLFPSQELGNNTFKMVPVEKWYKFGQKSQFRALTIEEAEARMGKRVKDPRWFMETQKASEFQRKEEMDRFGSAKLFTRKGERGERRIKGEGDDETGEVVADADDIDYNYDEAFADDEENQLFGGDDEQNKEAEEKIKRERQEANIFELKEEKDYDKEEEEAKKKAQAEKKLAKRVAKALMTREKNLNYEEDSDGNPYSSSSESEDSEVERQKAEEAKKEEEKKAEDNGKTPAAQDKTGSDVSTKGSNTPSGRPKPNDPLRKTLKRAGSPNLSEASGSESAHKKKIKVHSAAAGVPTPSISRPISPVNNGSTVRNPLLAGSGSEPEMSDGSARRVKKIKIRTSNGSLPPSPNGTRASSPVAGVAPSPLAEGAPVLRQRPAAPAVPATLPTAEEIRKAIPPEGIALSQIIGLFKSSIKNPAFIPLIKANTRFDGPTKMLYPKDA